MKLWPLSLAAVSGAGVLFAAGVSFCATAASASQDAPATFTTPPGFTRLDAGPVSALTPPEGNLHIEVVSVGPSDDARTATIAAWRLVGRVPGHAIRLISPAPARDGWDEAAAVSYETSPAEHLALIAVARRKGQAWTVVLVSGDQGTAEKRSGPLGVALQSLRPAGYVRENFSAMTAHRLTPERVEALLEFTRAAAAQLHVPGVGIALIQNGAVIYEGGVGIRELGSPEPVDAHTRFIIASNTKGMTTLLLARAVDEGLLSWDEPVVQAYPGFRLGSDKTTQSVLIRHLVCACTGVPRKDYEVLFTNTPKTPASSTFAMLAMTEPTSKFGEVFQYNNLMAAAAGYIAGHAFYPDLEVGAAYDRAMQTKIFDPLRMGDTTFDMDKALAADHASPHSEDSDGRLRVIGEDLNRTFTSARPAGGAWSSPHDMILYVADELSKGRLPDGRILVSEKNLLIRREHGVPIGEDQWYGMGLMQDATWGVPVVHHGGDLAGFHSDIIAIPSADVGAVILTNADHGALMRRPFLRRLLEILYDGRPEAAADAATAAENVETQLRVERARLEIPAAAPQLNGLIGVYENPVLGRLTLERRGADLVMIGTAWQTPLATRKNDDGTIALVAIDPQLHFEFVVGEAAGKRNLTTRDGQHVYVFEERS